MSRKSKTILIIILLLLCLLAGAWLLLIESRSDRAESGSGNSGSDAIQKAVESGSDCISAEMIPDAEAAIGEWMTNDRVYSHRGSAGPNEHSFEAYDAAIEAGSHNIEQDIVISKDGTLYVSHDLTAAAMTGDARAYADMSDSEIDALTTNNGGRILKLGEVFEHYGDKVRYVVELKSGDDATIDAFKSVVDEHDKAERIIVQCFDISVLEKLESIYPDMPKLYLCESQADISAGINADFTDNISVDSALVSAANCDAVHDAGKQFTAWTLDSESDITNAIDVGADAYFTNNTPLAIELEHRLRPVKVQRQGITEKKDTDENADTHSTIFFASDYQGQSAFNPPRETLTALAASVVSAGNEPDAVVFCGDYSNDGVFYNYNMSPDDSISEIKDVMETEMPYLQDENFTFVQGNHDAMSDSISRSGLHEYEDYLLYVLNTEEDFPWSQGKTSGCLDKVRASSSAMKKCFDDLISKGETRPVFIAGHVPLHYTARTSSRHSTGDNLYSSLIFNVVNDAARSLDIVYMYGHNHSKGWDCYLGGAAVYRAAGDSIILPVFESGDVNTDKFEEKTLNFTYMNAGYTGYYMNCSPSEYDGESFKAADETLTATICEVFPDRIEITRYDADGQHVLGAAGEADPYKGGIDQDLIGSEYYSRVTEGPAVIRRSSADAGDDAADDRETLDEAA